MRCGSHYARGSLRTAHARSLQPPFRTKGSPDGAYRPSTLLWERLQENAAKIFGDNNKKIIIYGCAPPQEEG